jgi:hypothetical protein
MTKRVVRFIAVFVFLFFVLVAFRTVVGFGFKVSYLVWKPRIVCNEATYNFGSIANSNPSHEFVIQNIGSRELLLHKVVAGCGSCVEIESFTKTAIVPKGSGSVKLKLLTDSLSGKVAKDVLVRSNDPKNPNLVLTLEAEITHNKSEQK